MTEDAELLRRYLEEKSESAFAELVRRHLPLVYSAAFRKANGDAHLAEDIAQKVFSTLARKARLLKRHPALGGWLYKTTQFAALDALREQQRLSRLEQHLIDMDPQSTSEGPSLDWAELRPLIDQALSELKEGDRDAVLLRYFEGRSFAEVGQLLRLSENAARMRVDRAMERLRQVLARHGLKSTTAALAGTLTLKAFETLPPDLADSLTKAALSVGSQGLGLLPFLSTLPIMTKVKLLLTAGLATAGLAAATAFLLAAPTDPRADLSKASRQQAVQAVSQGEAPVVALSGQVKRHHAATLAISSSPQASKLPAYQNCGQANPADAYKTFAWASDAGDVATLSRLITFEGQGREAALKVLAAVPESIRDDYKTPEALYAFFIIADTINYPPPPPEMFNNPVVNSTGANQVGITCKPGSQNAHTYVSTPDGWKFQIPEVGVEALPKQILKGECLPKSK